MPSSAKETYPLIYANESGTRKLVFTSGAKAIGRSGVAYTREPSSDNEATGRCAARSRVSESVNTSTPMVSAASALAREGRTVTQRGDERQHTRIKEAAVVVETV